MLGLPMKALKAHERALKAITHVRKEIGGALTVSAAAYAELLTEGLRIFSDGDEYGVFLRDETGEFALSGGSPRAETIIAPSPPSRDTLGGNVKFRCDNRNDGSVVDRRWKSWILFSIALKGEPWISAVLTRKSRRYSEAETEAAKHLAAYFGAALKDIRSRNKKAAHLAEEARHRSLLRTQSGLGRENPAPENYGCRQDLSALTGSDAALVFRNGEASWMSVLCDVTADDEERQTALVYIDTWFSVLSQTSLDAKGILRRLNADMVRRRGECYASAAVIKVDPKKRRAEISGCGSVTAYIFRHETMTAEVIAFGAAAGISADTEIGSRIQAVESGDILCACSDGLTEARKKGGDLVGAQAVADVITRNYFLGAEDLAAKILTAVTESSRSGVNADDRTVQVIKID